MKNPKINYEEYELTNGECVAKVLLTRQSN